MPLIVDNTFASPYLCRPIEHGADIVIHSATKFIGGHGTAIGGVIVDCGQLRLERRQAPGSRSRPGYHGLRYADLGEQAYIPRPGSACCGTWAAPCRPFNAFLFLQGLETLHLRMERHSENALAVARFLEEHPEVEWVDLPGLPSRARTTSWPAVPAPRAGGHPRLRHPRRPGGRGGASSSRSGSSPTWPTWAIPSRWRFTRPHHPRAADRRGAAGGRRHPGVVRLSVGTEEVEDLIDDLDQALKKSQSAVEV